MELSAAEPGGADGGLLASRRRRRRSETLTDSKTTCAQLINVVATP